MSDTQRVILVKRTNYGPEELRVLAKEAPTSWTRPGEALRQAADEIERLRFEIEGLWYAYAHDADADTMTKLFENALGLEASRE